MGSILLIFPTHHLNYTVLAFFSITHLHRLGFLKSNNIPYIALTNWMRFAQKNIAANYVLFCIIFFLKQLFLLNHFSLWVKEIN